MNIKIYFAQVEMKYDEEKFESLLSDLPGHWIPSITKYRRSSDQMLSLGAKWLLHRAIKLHNPEAVLSFDDGIPKVVNETTKVSISHTEGMVACAISDYQSVGIDVEAIRPVDPAHFKSVLTNHERELLSNSKSDKDALFFDIWTRKESIAKACWRGMYLGFDSFNAHDPVVIIETVPWKTTALRFSGRYVAAVAFSANEDPVIIVSKEQILL